MPMSTASSGSGVPSSKEDSNNDKDRVYIYPQVQKEESLLENFSPTKSEPSISEPQPLIVRRLPNGAVITEDPNNIQPYRVTTWPDGTRLVDHYLDGINVLHQPDGTRTTTFADGSVVRTFPSGKKVVNRP